MPSFCGPQYPNQSIDFKSPLKTFVVVVVIPPQLTEAPPEKTKVFLVTSENKGPHSMYLSVITPDLDNCIHVFPSLNLYWGPPDDMGSTRLRLTSVELAWLGYGAWLHLA